MLPGPGASAHFLNICFDAASIHLPKLHIVPVDETASGFDGGVIVGTIYLNRPNEPAV
jgi:hypothetical protein